MNRVCMDRPALTPAQMESRLSFARANINRDWSRVIFSDEKTWPTDQRYIGRLTEGIWGWISAGGPGEICFTNGRLNRYSYMEILEEVLLPSLSSYPNEKMVFVHDKSLVHTARIVKDWFEDHYQEIELIENWPSNSYDLNLMENFWEKTTREWRRVYPRYLVNLENAITQVWEEHRGNSQYFDRLFGSMPDRLAEVINNNGGHTSY